MIHEKNLRVSLCVQELCHLQDSRCIPAAISVFRNGTGLSVLARDLHFYYEFGILFGLFNNSCDVSEEYGSLRSCLSTLSPVEDVIGVEVDKLEEDLG